MIQVLRNAVRGGRLSDVCETSATKTYGSTLLALQGGGCRISRKKRYGTLEWPQINLTKIIDIKNMAWKKWNGILNIWKGKNGICKIGNRKKRN